MAKPKAVLRNKDIISSRWRPLSGVHSPSFGAFVSACQYVSLDSKYFFVDQSSLNSAARAAL
jgi:hypothetical protein